MHPRGVRRNTVNRRSSQNTSSIWGSSSKRHSKEPSQMHQANQDTTRKEKSTPFGATMAAYTCNQKQLDAKHTPNQIRGNVRQGCAAGNVFHGGFILHCFPHKVRLKTASLHRTDLLPSMKRMRAVGPEWVRPSSRTGEQYSSPRFSSGLKMFLKDSASVRPRTDSGRADRKARCTPACRGDIASK